MTRYPFILLLLVLLLVGCGGTLDISVEPSAEPPSTVGAEEAAATDVTPATQTPTPNAPQLATYTHPRFGYTLPVPAGAQALELDDEYETLFFLDEDGEQQSFFISVTVVPELPDMATLSPLEFMYWLAETEPDASAPQLLQANEAGVTPALLTYSGGEGTACQDTRIALIGILAEQAGYAVRVGSDRPEQCNAAALPLVEQIAAQFSPPPGGLVLEMTPTPTPASTAELSLAFIRDANVWLWRDGLGETQLTRNGGVESLYLSDDGTLIAFLRPDGLWVVDAEGNGERQLVSNADLPVPDLGDISNSVVDVVPNQVGWIPGTHQLLFNTNPRLQGPGLLLADDLWWVDADSGEVRNLFPAGDGGNFVLSPDGNSVSLIQPDTIYVAATDGSERRHVLNYTPVTTYSEHQFYVNPVWAPDGSSLRVIIPPPDPRAQPPQPYTLWKLNIDGTPSQMIASFGRASDFPIIAAGISPDLSQLAYLDAPPDNAGQLNLLLRSLGDTLGDPALYASDVQTFDGWSPAGTHFHYTPDFEQIPYRAVGRVQQDPLILAAGDWAVIDITWIDDQRFVFVQESDRGWDLYLADVHGNSRQLIAIGGPPPIYDIVD
ncbi:MAG: hypothetical protein R3300_20535 [Candidatus Promineifilaceae bacterium]|nr:hypothetical protein [Candidatus Promineifilaceae bacterium]